MIRIQITSMVKRLGPRLGQTIHELMILLLLNLSDNFKKMVFGMLIHESFVQFVA